MKKINLLLLLLIFISSCSVNQKHQAINYYGKTVDVKKCSNLICRKHKIHYNESGIFFKNDSFQAKTTFKRESPLDFTDYESKIWLEYTIKF